MAWDDLLLYFYTFSALHTFHERHPDDKKHPEGDIAQRFLKRLQELATKKDGESSGEVDVEWPLALILARRT